MIFFSSKGCALDVSGCARGCGQALLDCGEARFDHRLKFEVGEDICQVLFDAFADEFTDIVGFYALRDAFPEHIDPLGTWARSRQGRERPLEALGEIAS